VEYIGSRNGIEKEIVGTAVPYHGISSGKLRRYMDWRNVTDVFRVLAGIWQAFRLLKVIRPDVVFSKGGFVSVPVVISAWLRRIPVIVHEADMSPGLANRLAIPFARRICFSFSETTKHLPADRSVHTGLPIRKELLKGSREQGRELCGFEETGPVLLVMGGSLGSEIINGTVRKALDELLRDFQVVHICGKGKVDKAFLGTKRYRQFEFLTEELPHIVALADVIVSRAGANSLFEILALKIPNLLIPLSLRASRGDQIVNARSFENHGYSRVLEEESLNPAALVREIKELFGRREYYLHKMESSPVADSSAAIVALIEECTG
jgi:UDP-N-acetylglucosamine--N-acetylmuramyl-(pentapeptide) pyrophosphoryl-undecaprenol N-acetylglucosamine transferase